MWCLRVAYSGISLLFILSATLDIRAESGCIQGRVLDASGAPVPSTFVTAFSVNRKLSVQVGTDKDGSFLIQNEVVAGEEYDLLASDSSEDQSVDSSETTTRAAIRAIAAEEDRCPFVTLRQRARARLEVEAINLLTRAPISPVDVRFRFSAEKSWRGGTYDKGELLLPPDSHLEVQFGAAGFEDSEVLTILTPAAGKRDNLVVALRPVQTGCIAGTIVDQNGSPVPTARLQAISSGQSFESGGVTFSGAGGRFKFEGIRPGEYSIFIYAAEYPLPLIQPQDMVGHVTVASGIACADGSKRLGSRAAKLRLRVMDAATQELLKEAPVYLTGSIANGGWSLNAGAFREDPAEDDRVDLVPVPALTAITVQASSKGYANSQTLTIPPLQPQEVQEITIVLQPNPRQ
jgi:hypothetical protein